MYCFEDWVNVLYKWCNISSVGFVFKCLMMFFLFFIIFLMMFARSVELFPGFGWESSLYASVRLRSVRQPARYWRLEPPHFFHPYDTGCPGAEGESPVDLEAHVPVPSSIAASPNGKSRRKFYQPGGYWKVSNARIWPSSMCKINV